MWGVGVGCGVWVVGCGVRGERCEMWGHGFRVQGVECRVWGVVCSVVGAGCRVQGVGCGVWSAGCGCGMWTGMWGIWVTESGVMALVEEAEEGRGARRVRSGGEKREERRRAREASRWVRKGRPPPLRVVRGAGVAPVGGGEGGRGGYCFISNISFFRL